MENRVIKPKKLKKGDTIGVFAPGTPMPAEELEAAAENLRSFGFKVKIHPQCHMRHDLTAGTTEQRAQAMNDLFGDDEVDAIFAMRGGLRVMNMLDKIDYDLIAKNPKIFIGYSDSTFLLSTLRKRNSLVTFHGLTLMRYHAKFSRDDQEKTLSFLQGGAGSVLWKDQAQVETIKSGTAEGELIGGNMTGIMALLAMDERFRPDLSGKILMVEDIDEEIRQIDRMLSILSLSGAREKLAGLVIGGLHDIRDTGTNNKFNRPVKDIVMERLADWKIPVAYNAPFGHDYPNLPFPIGVKARLTAPENGIPSLELLESPFADA
jgi:muramoyltetrapeptide carboxypeptidase